MEKQRIGSHKLKKKTMGKKSQANDVNKSEPYYGQSNRV